MAKVKPVCETIFPWLRENIGTRSLAGLTGTDYRALCAAAQIIELWSYSSDPDACIRAFGLVAGQMQPSMRFAAYYCVAHVANWSDCVKVWILAGLPPIKGLPRCKHDCRGEAWVSYTEEQARELRTAAGYEANGADVADRADETAAEGSAS